VRQWVWSFPIPLRFLFAAHPQLLAPVLQIVHRVISGFLVKQSGLKRPKPTPAPSRFSSVSDRPPMNIPLHCLVLDGVYRITEDAPVFHSVRAPTAEQLQLLLVRIMKRLMRLLTRKGDLIEEQGMTYLAATFPDAALAPLQVAACTYRIALGPRAGQLEFMQQLAALVPRPRWHLIRCQGVLAPNAKLHPALVPSAPANAHLGLSARAPPRHCTHIQTA
jgi:hypothetical protein